MCKTSLTGGVYFPNKISPDVSFSLDFPPGNHWSYSAIVRTKEESFNLLVSPETGRITKTRRRDGYSWSLSFWLRQFHGRLLLGLRGRVFVGIFGVTIFLSCIPEFSFTGTGLNPCFNSGGRRGDGYFTWTFIN